MIAPLCMASLLLFTVLSLAGSLVWADVKSQPKAGSSIGVPVTLDRLEATINGALILKTDIDHFRKTLSLRQQLDPLFAGTPLAGKGAQGGDKEVIDYLIDEQIILNLFPVADSEVEQEINTIQSNNRMDRKTLRSALGEQGFSFEDYFQLIRVGVAKRGLIDRDIRTKVSISDDDVKNHFYNTIARNSAVPRAFKVRILTISPSNYKSSAAANEVIVRARKQIHGGEAFEDVAKAVSDDPSASNGGDLGTLTEDQMSPVIREALKKLKIGETSQVLGDAKTRYFILKLVDVTSAESDRFKQQKEEIRGQLAAGEYQRQIQLWLDRQRQTASIHRTGQKRAAETASQ
jgi:peptidyl-prolyl cis-trans isomerase SurA